MPSQHSGPFSSRSWSRSIFVTATTPQSTMTMIDRYHQSRSSPFWNSICAPDFALVLSPKLPPRPFCPSLPPFVLLLPLMALYFTTGVSCLFLRLFRVFLSFSLIFFPLSSPNHQHLTRVTFLRVQVTRGLECSVPMLVSSMGDSAEQPLHQHHRQP